MQARQETDQEISEKLYDSYSKTEEIMKSQDLDDILYTLIEYDSKIRHIINNIMSYTSVFNLTTYLDDIEKYTKKYGKKELLIFLFSKGFICIDSFSRLKEKKHFVRTTQLKSHILASQIVYFYNCLNDIIEKNENGIIYFTTDIQVEIENVKYRKTKKLYSIQKDLETQIGILESKIANFNKDILSMVSIILAIVPIIAINANAASELTLESALSINGCLILSITTVYFLVAVTLLERNMKKLWFFLLPFFISILMICGAVFLQLNTASIQYNEGYKYCSDTSIHSEQ